jgi:type VI secretion system FHA domain protein
MRERRDGYRCTRRGGRSPGATRRECSTLAETQRARGLRSGRNARIAFDTEMSDSTTSRQDVADGADAARRAELEAALLRGLGITGCQLPNGLDEPTMEALGALLREMTQGTVDMLRNRSQAKSSIHAEMTIIGPHAVNPLKAAWDVDVALKHLLAPQRVDLMSPVRAATDAWDDLRAHDRGLAAGIEAALQTLLKRFAPASFEERLASQGGFSFMSGNKKARQWDLLLELYEDIAREAQQDFWAIFEREFRRAYSIGQDTAPLSPKAGGGTSERKP